MASSSQAQAQAQAAKKRPATEPALGTAERAEQAQPPSKRRRLGQASVLCMRELVRAIVRDGNISDDDRLMLQNVGLLLSQVDGKTWVNFPDSQGELQALAPPQLRCIRPFLEKVAQELRAHEMELASKSTDNEEHLDCLKLVEVPWADGITSNELLYCCGPDAELELPPRLRFLERLTRVLPTKYMIRSRARELINHYYIKHSDRWSVQARPSTPCCSRPPLFQRVAGIIPGAETAAACLGSCRARLAVARIFVVPYVRGARNLLVRVAKAPVKAISFFVFAAVAILVDGVSRISTLMPLSQEPVWPTLRFFCACFLQGKLKQLLEFLVLVARLRVILCLASCYTFLGWLFYPFVFIVKKVLGCRDFTWLLGCSCDAAGHGGSGSLSVLSWLPVTLADGLVVILTQVRWIPVLGAALEPFARAVEYAHPGLALVLDLTFSVGMAEGLSLVMKQADEHFHAKLVWMSMNVSRMLREGYVSAPAPAATALPAPVALDAAPVAAASQSGSGEPPQASSPAVPAWSEGGDWNLFD